MEQAVESKVYGLADYVADLRRITAETEDAQRIVEQVRPLAQRMAENCDGWLKPEYYEYDEEMGAGLNMLHEEDDHSLAVFTFLMQHVCAGCDHAPDECGRHAGGRSNYRPAAAGRPRHGYRTLAVGGSASCGGGLRTAV